MRIDDLRRHLESSFHPPAAVGLDAVFRLDIADEHLQFRVEHGRLRFAPPEAAAPDATFLFADHETAWALLSGQADAFEAFMDGRFRADGYLMWAFRLMAMFKSASLPVTPVE